MFRKLSLAFVVLFFVVLFLVVSEPAIEAKCGGGSGRVGFFARMKQRRQQSTMTESMSTTTTTTMRSSGARMMLVPMQMQAGSCANGACPPPETIPAPNQAVPKK